MPAFRSAALTDPGRVRTRNEDAFHVDADRGLAIVADGMGGHPAGDLASDLAVRQVVERLGGAVPGSERSAPAGETGNASPAPSGDSGVHRDLKDDGAHRDADMAETVRAANRRILQDGEENPEHRGMGTTLTLLSADLDAGRYRIGHVGDSRCYLYRDGSLAPLTRDHTPLQEEVDAGRLSREEARIHPMSHVLSQALGTTPDVEPQVETGSIEPGDVFLLCTDGLTAVLSEDEIEALIRTAGPTDPEEVARSLVNRTLEGGAPDNVTVVLLLAT